MSKHVIKNVSCTNIRSKAVQTLSLQFAIFIEHPVIQTWGRLGPLAVGMKYTYVCNCSNSRCCNIHTTICTSCDWCCGRFRGFIFWLIEVGSEKSLITCRDAHWSLCKTVRYSYTNIISCCMYCTNPFSILFIFFLTPNSYRLILPKLKNLVWENIKTSTICHSCTNLTAMLL